MSPPTPPLPAKRLFPTAAPHRRMGHFSHGGPFTAPQLKIIQEFIRWVLATRRQGWQQRPGGAPPSARSTRAAPRRRPPACCSLTVFAIFAVVVLKEKLRWVDLGAFVLIMAGVALGMVGKPAQQQVPPPPPPPADAAPPAPLDESGRRLLLLGLQPQPASGGSGGGGSEGQGSPTGEQAGLPSGALHAVHELRGSGSARVLLAYDSDLCAGSSHQGVRRREPTYDVEAGGSRGLAGGAEQAAASDAPWEAHAAGGGGEEAEAAAAK